MALTMKAMASSPDYLTFVLDLLRNLPGIHYRKMMGEYLLYQDEVLFGGIYDNRFLVKKTDALAIYRLKEAIPYPGAKTMFVIETENPDEVRGLVETLVGSLRK